MFITKKILVAFDPITQQPINGEFLVPIEEKLEYHFFGLKGSARFQQGILIFLGKELGSDAILARLTKCIAVPDQRRAVAAITAYLEELQKFKIGNIVTLETTSDSSYGFRLTLLTNTPKVQPRALP